MSEVNKEYRIRTTVGQDSFIPLTLEQEYDVLDILSLKIRSKDTFKLHNANVGIIVGRVQANNGFGIPNAKISVFVQTTEATGTLLRNLYPFANTASKTKDGVRYNLLPNEKTGDCHQVVGTFPNKRYVLDNDVVLEVFDKYYKYTTRTNNSGDYLLAGVPTGNHMVHVDVDLSDCGILSQRPRDFVYKGYTVEQFENPNMFKSGTEYSNLSQVFTQNKNVYVFPYWGNESLGEQIGLTRLDFDIAYTFEPTCVFIGSVIGDNASQGISKRCIPTENMGNMDELVAGKGTIEMIRKTVGGDVEEFQVKGTELINGDGIWCYQIPMNLDYMMTDEFGNMVPTDSPGKGIPTRTRVRFRVSMEDMEENTNNFFRAKILVPHNPQNTEGVKHELYDYEFGSLTKDESFRDLFWNNVYTVKSYIPRFQKKKVLGWNTKKFTGIKGCQNFGSNNPMPYNNIRIHLPLMFTVMCILIKAFIRITAIFNSVIAGIGNALAGLANLLWTLLMRDTARKVYALARKLKLNVIEDGLCPDLENWYFAPLSKTNVSSVSVKHRLSNDDNDEFNILQQTLKFLNEDDGDITPKDEESIDVNNQDDEDEGTCITTDTNYLIACMEMNLALEYKVINFDFYNDWINGVLYFPRWMRDVRTKRTYNGATLVKSKIKACMDDTAVFSKARRYTQLCSLGYEPTITDSYTTFSRVKVNLNNKTQIKKANKYHKKIGMTQAKIFGRNGGICHEHTTIIGQNVYYLKPCEWTVGTSPQNRKVNLFATDIVLLGSLNACDLFGLPQAFTHLGGTTYIMPPNIALTNLESESMLFTSANGRICSKTNSNSTPNNNLSTLHVVDTTSGNVLTNELKAYSGASSNYDTNFNGDENDTIALTELAGISWNYIGPGQGENVPKNLYYPGGHFLGLSCRNSQTNVKSCVNLERICEAGASMSQRKDEVAAVVNGEIKYVYTVPSGLIAGGDIVDTEFRTMFATMNQKRLIADKLNPQTGYLNYDFLFVRPSNFNGELNTYGLTGTYNRAIHVNDESQSLSIYGIADSSSSLDNDSEETAFTQVKTIEMTSVDYYRFRFGLDYSNLKSANGKHVRQFAASVGNKYYLPQYENSFYFYFGLKAGATAIDEFNKEFFAECPQSNLIEYDYGVIPHVDEYNFLNGMSVVTFETLNMEPELIYSIYRLDGTTYVTGNTMDIEFNVSLPYGTYIITVRDSEGLNSSAEFVVGDEVQAGVLNTQNFTLPIDSISGLQRNIVTSNIFYGGFVEINEAILSSDVHFLHKRLLVVNKGENVYSNLVPISSSVIDSSGHTVCYIDRKDVEMDVYIRFKCTGGNYVYIFLDTVMITDNSRLKLSIGSPKSYDFSKIKSASSIVWWDRPNNTAHTDFNWDEIAMSGWSIRNSIIKRTSSASTYENKISTELGDKMLFGTLQNYNGVYVAPDKKVYSNYYIEDWENGYTLDDEASYHPTYGQPYTPQINQYQASVIDGSDVMGRWLAKVSGDTGTTKSVILQNEDTSALRDGGACVLKSVKSSDVVGCVYRASTHTIECLCSDEDANSIEYGVVYPTIHYPVIQKEFKVNANYFYFSSVYSMELNNNNGINADLVDAYEFLEGEITNGLTYKGLYSGKSFMSGAFNFMPYIISIDENGMSVPTAIPNLSKFGSSGSNPDMKYFDEQSTGSFITPIGYVNAFPSNDRRYNIIEGFPLQTINHYHYPYSSSTQGALYEESYLYEGVVENRQLELAPTFYSQIKYIMSSNDNIVRFVGAGISDSNIEYYYIHRSEDALETFLHTGWLENDRKYAHVTDGTNSNPFKKFYMLFRYTSDNPKQFIGTEGAAKIEKADFGHTYITHIPIYNIVYNGTESSYTLTDVYCQYDKGSKFEEEDLPTMANTINTTTSGKVECIYQVSPKVEYIWSAKSQSDYESITNLLLPLLVDSRKLQMNFDYSTSFINPSQIVVVGISRYNDDPLATGNVCCIYSTLKQITASN